jgi:hypothetical protein
VNRRFGGTYDLHFQFRKLAEQESSVQQVATMIFEPEEETEMSVQTRTTRRCIPENGNIHNYGCENIRSYVNAVISSNMKEMGPPLWSSGQSSWLQIQGSRVRFPGTTKKVVGLERDPLSLMSTTEEYLIEK